MAKIPEKYRKRLMGLIPIERIKTWQIPRPSKSLLQELLSFDGLTPTLSDILDSMGLTGAVPGSVLKPVLSGKKIAGPAVTLKYIPEQMTPAQSFHDKARAKLADRDAYALTEPGDIVVIDGGGMAEVSAMGGLSTTVAKSYGLAGNIVDCGVRDVAEMRESRLSGLVSGDHADHREIPLRGHRNQWPHRLRRDPGLPRRFGGGG